jgi:hypothetical protein
MGAIKGMERFYSWGGIFQKLMKRDIYYAGIRFWGKKMLKEWWKDEENAAHVRWLRDQLYAEREALGAARIHTVGVPSLLLQDATGRQLSRFLNELGVTVVPLAEAAAEAVDCLVTPIVKRMAAEKAEFYGALNTVTQGLQARLGSLPRISFPVVDGQGPVFEPFARIGLLVTGNLKRIRQAYKSAGVAEGLWETA